MMTCICASDIALLKCKFNLVSVVVLFSLIKHKHLTLNFNKNKCYLFSPFHCASLALNYFQPHVCPQNCVCKGHI